MSWLTAWCRLGAPSPHSGRRLYVRAAPASQPRLRASPLVVVTPKRRADLLPQPIQVVEQIIRGRLLDAVEEVRRTEMIDQLSVLLPAVDAVAQLIARGIPGLDDGDLRAAAARRRGQIAQRRHPREPVHVEEIIRRIVHRRAASRIDDGGLVIGALAVNLAVRMAPETDRLVAHLQRASAAGRLAQTHRVDR